MLAGATAGWLGLVGSVLLGSEGKLLLAAAWTRGYTALAGRNCLVN